MSEEYNAYIVKESAILIAESIAALAEVEAMKIANSTAVMNNQIPPYGEDSFRQIINDHGLHENSYITKFRY